MSRNAAKYAASTRVLGTALAQPALMLLLLHLLLQTCASVASAATSRTQENDSSYSSRYSNSSLPLELFNAQQTRSQAAGLIAKVNFQKLSRTPSHQLPKPPDFRSSVYKRPTRTFSPGASRVAVVNPYLWSYPTIAAIAEAVRASGIRPEVNSLV